MKTILRLLSYIKYYWRTFLVGNILLIISVALSMILPRIVSYIIDFLLIPIENTGIIPWEAIQKALLIYGVLAFTGAILNYLAQQLLIRSSNRFTQALRNEIYGHIHRMPIHFFDTVPAGTIVSRITNDTETIRINFYVNVFADLLVALAQILGLLIALASIRIELLLMALILLPGMALFSKIYSKHASPYLKDIREFHGQVNGQINEITKNIQMAQSYGQEEEVLDHFQDLTQKKWEVSDKFTRFDWKMFNIPANFTRLLMYLAIAWLVYGHLELAMPVSPGMLYLVVEYMTSLMNPINIILDVFAQITQAIVSASRVFAILDRPIEEDGDRVLDQVDGQIETQNIYFSYPGGPPVLKGIDFEAKAGQTVAILGPTGSGKSSLLNLLFRFYDPDSGQVLIDGIDLKTVKRQSLRQHMGIVLQEAFLFEGSIYSNISLNNPLISRSQAEDALKKVGGEGFFRDGHKGLDEEITERGKNLSAGQKQLISFARALAYNPKILILDEATASIDTETEQIIQRAMDIVKEGRTTIIIAHRLSTIRDADCIYVLKAGRIVEKGLHEELLNQKGPYYAMVSMQNQA